MYLCGLLIEWYHDSHLLKIYCNLLTHNFGVSQCWDLALIKFTWNFFFPFINFLLLLLYIYVVNYNLRRPMAQVTLHYECNVIAQISWKLPTYLQNLPHIIINWHYCYTAFHTFYNCSLNHLDDVHVSPKPMCMCNTRPTGIPLVIQSSHYVTLTLGHWLWRDIGHWCD